MRELSIPPGAAAAPNSHELLRAWVIEDSLHCTLAPEVWEEPANWGVMLADVARHVANALAETRGLEQRKTLTAIAELFNAELNSPTDEPSGFFV